MVSLDYHLEHVVYRSDLQNMEPMQMQLYANTYPNVHFWIHKMVIQMIGSHSYSINNYA